MDLGETKISETDFKKIKEETDKIIRDDEAFERFTKPVDEAIAWAKNMKQSYEEELLNDLRRAGTTVARDLSPEEMGTLAEDDSKIEEV